MYIALVLTLILGTPLLSLIGAIAVGLPLSLQRWSTVGTATNPVFIPLLIFATSAVDSAALQLPYHAQLYYCRHAFIGRHWHRLPSHILQSESKLMWNGYIPTQKQSEPSLCLTLQPWFWVGALACLSVGTVWGLALRLKIISRAIHLESSISTYLAPFCLWAPMWPWRLRPWWVWFAVAHRLWACDCYGAYRRSNDVYCSVHQRLG